MSASNFRGFLKYTDPTTNIENSLVINHIVSVSYEEIPNTKQTKTVIYMVNGSSYVILSNDNTFYENLLLTISKYL
jgi:hypothetical protein